MCLEKSRNTPKGLEMSGSCVLGVRVRANITLSIQYRWLLIGTPARARKPWMSWKCPPALCPCQGSVDAECGFACANSCCASMLPSLPYHFNEPASKSKTEANTFFALTYVQAQRLAFRSRHRKASERQNADQRTLVVVLSTYTVQHAYT